ncbi:MAG TPA: PAS domain S-box protein [Rhizomicrobium sp.]|jgi:PAS domain S-box-containing protein
MKQARPATAISGEAAADGEARVRALIEGATGYGIALLDPHGLITNWNRGAELMTGYSAQEMLGQPFGRLFTDEERRETVPARAIEEAMSTGHCDIEKWRSRKNGEKFYAAAALDAVHDDSDTLLGFVWILRDATAKRAADEALRESERQFRLLVAGVTDYALYMLDPNGVITSWNAGAQRIKGYRADEIIGHHYSRFFTPTDRAAGMPLRALATALHEGRYEAEGWRVRKDGSLLWVNAIIDAIRDEHGQLIGFAKITRDITERREAQIALQKSQEQLAQSQRLEALSMLTGGIAHDFNNLLMVVGGQAQMMKRRTSEAKDLRSLEAIETAADAGAKLTRQLLAFSRRQPLNAVVADIRERVNACRELLAATAGGLVDLSFDVDHELWPVELDPTEFELALVNLVVNARDAMPKGGTLGVSAKDVRLSGEGTPPLTGQFVAVSVSDTGQGIAPDILPRIFEPFFTTKQVGKGSGLGLSQVYGFCTQSKGGISVVSELGRGTTVTMYLPRTHKQPAADTSLPAAGQSQASGTILVVEDNPEVAKVSSMLLEQIGYTVVVVDGAQAALRTLEQGAHIDLVFTDVVMPGDINGLQLAGMIAERYPGMPILLTTGYANAVEIPERRFPVLRKPYQISALADAVGRALADSEKPG